MKIWDIYYQKIGPVGVVLLVIMVISCYLGIKNYLKFLLMEWQFKKFAASLDAGNIEEINHNDYPRNYLILIVLDIVKYHRFHSSDLRAEVAFLFHKYFLRIQKNLSFLKLVSVISPLLGLMGTVLGIIEVFRVIGGENGGQVDNSQLALGIGQALYTTVLGMVITIPVLAIFYHLKNRLAGFVLMVIEYCYLAMGMLDEKEGTNERL